MKLIDENWISLRDRWPFQRGEYRVYDCKEDIEGVARYDGIDFIAPQWIQPIKGSLLLPEPNRISHWKK